MKIAVITDDGQTISAHFGRAGKCAVIEVADGEVVRRELRDMPSHAGGDHDHSHNTSHDHSRHSHHHGQHRFPEKLAVMQDCRVVLCRGMGNPAYEKLVQAGLQPILTDIVEMETAVQAYLDGTIVDNPRRRHQ